MDNGYINAITKSICGVYSWGSKTYMYPSAFIYSAALLGLNLYTLAKVTTVCNAP